MSLHHRLVQLGMDLGLAVNDYNVQDTDSFDEITKLSLAYVAKVKEGVMSGLIKEEDMMLYLGLMGESWASIQPRLANEYILAPPPATTVAHDKAKPKADPSLVGSPMRLLESAVAAAIGATPPKESIPSKISATAPSAAAAAAAATAPAAPASGSKVTFSDTVVKTSTPKK